jgi:hypothetical protein
MKNNKLQIGIAAALVAGGATLTKVVETILNSGDTTARARQELCTAPDMSDGHSNTPQYYGGCLDSFKYLYTENHGPWVDPLPSDVHGYQWPQVERKITVQAQEVGGITVYKVEGHAEGETIDLCEDAKYVPLSPKEKQQWSDDDVEKLRGKALAVPGYWDEAGQYHRTTPDGKNVFALACMSGAVAKCALWGYSSSGPESNLEPYLKACVYAARARYDKVTDEAFTKDGVIIDVYDRLGIGKRDTQLDGTFEAAWGADGLVCMGRPRIEGCADRRAVTTAPPCTFTDADSPDKWPANVLIVTRSTPTNEACPVKLVKNDSNN